MVHRRLDITVCLPGRAVPSLPQRQPHPSVAGIGAQEAAAALGTVSIVQAISRQMIGSPAHVDPVAASRAAPLDVAGVNLGFLSITRIPLGTGGVVPLCRAR